MLVARHATKDGCGSLSRLCNRRSTLYPVLVVDKLPFEPYPGATSVIGQIFRNTDTTYKFFWFLSLLDKAKVTGLRTDLQIEIKEFAQLSVARYFEARNPGIPGIINKLERPGMRKLEKARAFWDTILSKQPLQCIYSGEPIQAGYDLDHFLPWSFVTHDLIWNLTPAPAAINLAKSDAVPNLSRYLAAFVDQHYAAMPVLKSALANVRGVQLRALEAITLEDASQEPGVRSQNSEFRNELRSAQLSENLTSHAQVEDRQSTRGTNPERNHRGLLQ